VATAVDGTTAVKQTNSNKYFSGFAIVLDKVSVKSVPPTVVP
jgi:hypothetical protein